MTTERPNKWGKIFKASTIFLVALLCIGGVSYSRTDLGQAAGSYEKNRQAAIQAGAVFDKESAAPLCQVPANDNAAPIILDALKTIEPLVDKVHDKKLSKTEFSTIWRKLEPAFKTIEQGCQRQHLIFKHDLSTATFEPSPEYRWMRAWIRAMCRQAFELAEQNDLNGTCRVITTAAKLSSMISDTPDDFALLQRGNNASIVETLLSKLISLRANETRWLALISEALQILEKPYDLRAAMKRRHWFSIYVAKTFTGSEPTPEGLDEQYEAMGFQLSLMRLIPRIEKAYLSRVHEYYALALNSYPRDLYDFRALQSWEVQLDRLINQPGMSWSFPPFTIPQISGFTGSLLRETVQRITLVQALEMIRLKQDPTKGLPLKGRFALDIDGKPLRVKKKQGGWIIYSVGRDKVDDGGAELIYSKGDFVVHLPKVKS